jgi:RecA/RadA recombinase
MRRSGDAWRWARADSGGVGEGAVVEVLGMRGSGKVNLGDAIRNATARAGDSGNRLMGR